MSTCSSCVIYFSCLIQYFLALYELFTVVFKFIIYEKSPFAFYLRLFFYLRFIQKAYLGRGLNTRIIQAFKPPHFPCRIFHKSAVDFSVIFDYLLDPIFLPDN